MKLLILPLSLCLFFMMSACDYAQKKDMELMLIQESIKTNEEPIVEEPKDTVVPQKELPSKPAQKRRPPATPKEEKEKLVISRYLEFPSDMHFNGHPMTQQIELPAKIIELYPDTLEKMALASYRSYSRYFPVAIADDFENGISKEIIMYPKKLIFKYQVFEDENAAVPHVVKMIAIRRDKDGNLYVE